ncbi:tautomerase family protein [Conexibacter sp. JD483]|uniref:tautomerase family protein n=1 Tax=unclassified Conexibacter TaxID=2627773 RepID=UPI00271B3E05|nr:MULTISPECIES: tautomerase family protein [unclassified Conexibacter]MDO8188514.1 tautomerase family protein [Conexibacter sp. CPCC 205706]MDO8200142.1 tautomerase family protein [Conexibacter sp. CPCC 205762]MDR9371181.1 tautomerase family protein [Conexibacter sp. JD483]
MPLYECSTPSGMLDADQRQRLAAGITRIHAEETQAPEPFIRVVFDELAEGCGFTAGVPAPSVILRGGIRAGRSEDTRRAILTRSFELLREVTGAPAETIVISVMDFPSQWASEAGFILPEPTPEAEAAWLDDLEAAGKTA